MSSKRAEQVSAPGEEQQDRHFIQRKIDAELERNPEFQLCTRFPPEPNGYLHVGHAKAICVNFGLAAQYPAAHCNLRFDDTNPVVENVEYVEGIQEDIRWLGFDWEDRLYYASDYFEELFGYAVKLIESGDAYVCDLSVAQTREYRGTVNEAGRNSPGRERSVEQNLDLFKRMRAGEFEDGSRTLRARIDMASPNMNMRDPVMYRISRAHHHRTGNDWCIYPMYDWAHGQSDAIEGVTHSLCTLEFENHRALYDWFLEKLELKHRPQQIEFARLNLSYTITSKRKLKELVDGGSLSGWDDPRMPTLRGMRRRGYTPESLRNFCSSIGVARFNSTVDMVVLENALREDLNRRAERRMAVLRPLKLILTNYPEGESEEITALNNPEQPSAGERSVPFARELWIERDDFREEAPRKYFRLKPGQEVRLRYAYYVTCTGCVKDPDTGEVVEVHATYDPQTRGGDSADGRRVRGTIHWVSAAHAQSAEIRLYDHLFAVPNPLAVEPGQDWKEHLNPSSLEVIEGAMLEPSLGAEGEVGPFQFERQGYFVRDRDSKAGAPVFNRGVALRDSWAKLEKKLGS